MRPLTPAAAYALASQWGSFAHTDDPGRVFYTFPTYDARPQDEPHRTWCLAYTAGCLMMARYIADQAGQGDENGAVADLLALQRFFRESPLRNPERSAA